MAIETLRGAMLGDTPWGEVQVAQDIGPGIVKVSTSTHGGYILDEGALSRMPRSLRANKTFAGDGFFEEDCDWCLICLSFPQYFSDLDLFFAVKQFCSQHSVSEWRESAEARTVLDRVDAFVQEKGQLFYSGSMCTNGGTWSVIFTRIKDGQRAFVKEINESEIHFIDPIDIERFGARVTFPFDNERSAV